MICRHCGKEYSDEFAYCPYCAEPVRPIDRLTEEQRANYYKNITGTKNRIVSVLLGIVLFPISWIAIYLWNFVDLFLNDAEYYGGWTISLYAFLISIAVVVIGFLIEHFKSDKQKLIDIQFDNDETSICPQCGSHNIKIYRKGYNYKVGFWGAIFGVRGAGYAGGFDANKTCCRCMNCGKDWETDYDYRLIDK
jgi:hypothetical protein